VLKGVFICLIMKIKQKSLALLFIPLFALGFGRRLVANDSVVVGNVRVQCLSDSLVRLEWKSPEGFENRKTFHIVNRDWPGTAITTETNAGAREVVIRTARYVVSVPQNASSLEGVRVKSPAGNLLYQFNGLLTNSVWLPAPSEMPRAWSFADTPRIVPPPWGLTPAPADAKRPQTSGWDLDNNAPDVYVFVPDGSYRQLRQDFLKLTGPTEMPPLFAFGAFDSRWYNYTEATALKQIEAYRARKIPLDVLVVDTGWRRGASTGYQPNTNLFPNMRRFFREAHARHVRIMFNDHPEPVAATALAPKELQYRYDGLAGLLNEGLNIWWYDRNWGVALKTPAPNLRKEVWGMRLYHDMTQRVRPRLRPMIMANVDGIDNGIRHRPMDVAAHRFPIQWTGDIGPSYDYLRRAVENAVYSGVCSLFPYESDDLGGHVADPTPDGYIRWIEYGALSPIYRPHCTFDHERMPWVFGPEAERVARRFLDMRYRLLPVFYAAAHENYETGEPLLRRLDLSYPQFAEARRDDEYLLGSDLLVAPVITGGQQAVPEGWLKTPEGSPGLHAEYFTNDDFSGSPTVTRTDKNIDFDWGTGSPDAKLPSVHFSARWTGTIEVPDTITNGIALSTIEDDGVRVWIDGKQVIDAWGPHDSTSTPAKMTLAAGKSYQLRIEYQQLDGGSDLHFLWEPQENFETPRPMWIPPGNWINAWNGEIVAGPTNVVNQTPLDQEPIFVKAGSVLPLAPQMQYTSQKPWNPITLDLYPSSQIASATLYEDDTLTTAYRHGKFRTTHITASADEASKTVAIDIGAAQGSFSGARKKRAWQLRIHRPAGWSGDFKLKQISVDGKKVDLPVQQLQHDETAMPFGDQAGAPDGTLYEVSLPATAVSKEIQVKANFQ
jgi:PA14 domain/Glycosyl hydrolases family 31 TIM-barrel domain/Domain of unknown function (DUF5110)